MSLEGSGTPRRAGASDPGAAVPPDPEPAPFRRRTTWRSRTTSSFLARPCRRSPPTPCRWTSAWTSRPFRHHRGDPRGAARARVHEGSVGEDAGVVPVLPAVRPLRRAAPDAAGAKMSVVAVEPLPGSPDVHHMHLHVCDADSRAFQTHAALFEEGTSRPKTCLPPSWTPGSGCPGTAWTVLPGQEPVVFPEGVGFTVGGDDADGDDLAVRRVVLEVHYERRRDERAVSAVCVCGRRGGRKTRQRVGLLSVRPFARLPRTPAEQRTPARRRCTRRRAARVFASDARASRRSTC